MHQEGVDGFADDSQEDVVDRTAKGVPDGFDPSHWDIYQLDTPGPADPGVEGAGGRRPQHGKQVAQLGRLEGATDQGPGCRGRTLEEPAGRAEDGATGFLDDVTDQLPGAGKPGRRL